MASARRTSAPTIRSRRSTRSLSTPPGSSRSTVGSVHAAPTIDSAVGVFESSKACHATVTTYTPSPSSETVRPDQSRAKSRLRSGRSTPTRPRGRAAASSGSATRSPPQPVHLDLAVQRGAALPCLLRPLEEGDRVQAARVADPDLALRLYQPREQLEHLVDHAPLVQDVAAEHELPRRALEEDLRLRPVDDRGLDLDAVS